MKTIALCARFGRREEMRLIAKSITKATGHVVLSSWLDSDEEDDDMARAASTGTR
jgi:hypothetical protein